MKHLKTPQELNEASENLNISDVRSSKINEMYRDKPGEERSELMFKYGVDILPDNIILKDGKKIGKIETHMIPSGKYFVRDNTKRHLDLKDTFEDALKSMLD
jgi:hypothetical protein